MVRFRALAIVSALLALKTSSRSSSSRSGVQGRRGIPVIFASPSAYPRAKCHLPLSRGIENSAQRLRAIVDFFRSERAAPDEHWTMTSALARPRQSGKRARTLRSSILASSSVSLESSFANKSLFVRPFKQGLRFRDRAALPRAGRLGSRRYPQAKHLALAFEDKRARLARRLIRRVFIWV